MRIFSIGSYTDPHLRRLIYGLKYDKIRSISQIFARLIKKSLAGVNLEKIFATKEPIVIPIPLHRKKEKQRGFNQAEIIAQALSNEIKAPLEKNMLTRIKNTAPQMSLKDPKERAENIKNCFALNGSCTELADKDIIIVDDIYTSGATIKEAAKVLRKIKPKSITAFVIARA